ncbi:hypothetical protein GDO86_015116 [Hymenochirus boettgeri]|uniref:IF rod domain-containing protein n=1 Tax=Hymenochirus boettgeri TaxID=247094 RepID=A0A8T2JVD2_9PIPI|nr:hypothetical protein GDO86_015116 [Hymenochirus boettgeri]
MQDLNNRLASYLEKVTSLENSNKQLEVQIREKVLDIKPKQKDFSAQFNLIKNLQNQITDSVIQNTKLLLAIDNNKLAVDDFRVKWNTESAIRHCVEKDLHAITKVKEDHDSVNYSMKIELEGLESELLSLKNNHIKDLELAKESAAKGRVEVEVDAVQGPDLNSILSDIRSQYEDIMNKNKEEADALFQAQCEDVNLRLERESQESQTAQTELKEQKSILQRLQLELDSLYNQVNALKQDLDATQHGYKNELDRLQKQVSSVELELAEVGQTVQNNKLEYEALLRIKETLEAEIAEYRRLLEGDYEQKAVPPEPKQPDIRTKKIIKIVTQTLVDGKLVDESSEIEEYENAEKGGAKK